jgi:hypothetical protein
MSKGWPGQGQKGQKGIHRSGDRVLGKVIPNCERLPIIPGTKQRRVLKRHKCRAPGDGHSLNGPTDLQAYVAWQFTFGLELSRTPGKWRFTLPVADTIARQ